MSNDDNVTLAVVEENDAVIAVYQKIVEAEVVADHHAELMAIANNRRQAFDAVFAMAHLLFLLVGELSQEELHKILERIRTDYEDDFYEYQMLKIKQGERENE